MPADSSWKTPVVSPRRAARTSVASSSGMRSRSISTPRFSRTRSTACRRIVRFDRPEEVELQQAERFDGGSSRTGSSARPRFVASAASISSVSGSRLMTTPRLGVDRVRGDAFEVAWRSR
jgi:hypothetical protein